MEETRAYVGLCWNLPRSGPVTDPTRREKGSIDPLSGQCRLRDSAALDLVLGSGCCGEGGICVTLSLDEADPRFPPPHQGDAQ
jgi:hypothetical protein